MPAIFLRWCSSLRRDDDSWAIADFVRRVTTEGRPEYIPSAERIAVFDNDGCLWCEKPMPIELGFILRRLATMAEKDASLRERQPWKAAHEQDFAWLTAQQLTEARVLDSTWAGPSSPLRPIADAFLDMVRPATLIGKIAGLRQVPLQTSIALQTAGGTYGWIREGAPTPVGTAAFTAASLPRAKVGGVIVVSEELATNSAPSAISVLRREMEVLDRMTRVVELQHTCIEQLANRLEVLELEHLHQRGSKP
jgi:hypothetical protein